MSTPMLTGVGALRIRTEETGTNNNFIFPVFPFEWELAAESTSLSAQGQVNGVLQSLASTVGATTYTVRMTHQYLDWQTLSFFLNEKSASGTYTLPVLIQGTVPSGTQPTFTDARITTSTATSVTAWVSDSAGVSTRVVTTGTTLTATQVGVVGSSSAIYFHTSDSGKAYAVEVNDVTDTANSVGGTNASTYGRLSMVGLIYPRQDYIWFPNLTIQSAPSISLTGEVAALEVTFGANVPTDLNWNKPYLIVDTPTFS